MNVKDGGADELSMIANNERVAEVIIIKSGGRNNDEERCNLQCIA